MITATTTTAATRPITMVLDFFACGLGSGAEACAGLGVALGGGGGGGVFAENIGGGAEVTGDALGAALSGVPAGAAVPHFGQNLALSIKVALQEVHVFTSYFLLNSSYTIAS